MKEIANDWKASWARWEIFGVRFAEKPSEEEQKQESNALQEEVGFHISLYVGLCSVLRNVGARKSRKGKEIFCIKAKNKINWVNHLPNREAERG